MSLYRDVGVVLRTYKLGEADRIVVICTQNHGKVRAVAKGVRKTRSKFGSRLEPTSHVLLQLHEGRELDIVTQAESVEHFGPLREDLDRLGRAASILEAVDQVSQEREQNPQLYEMVVGALRAVQHWPSPLVVAAFFFKLLAAEGVGIAVEGCTECGRDDDLVALDLDSGGLRCSLHREGLPLSDEAVLMVQLILGGRMNQALSLPIGAATFEVDHLASVALERHIDRRLRTLRLLDRS